MADLSREELIAVCDRAVVPKEHWHDRDSYSAQKGVAICRMLLLTGHDFEVRTKARYERDGCVTDDRTIWVEVTNIRGFMAVEMGMGEGAESDTFYLPTAKRLDESTGRDWY